MKLFFFTSCFLLAASSATFAEDHVPTAGAPVISAPVKPGECVLACVPTSAGGGVGVTIKGGVGASAGGGTTGASCQFHCNRNATSSGTISGGGGDGRPRAPKRPPQHAL